MSFAATWMDLEVITLSEISQKEKDKYHMIPLICGIYNMTQMNLLTKQKQPHRHRKQCGCPSWGRDKLGVRDQQLQTTTYKIYKQQSPIVQHKEAGSISFNKP